MPIGGGAGNAYGRTEAELSDESTFAADVLKAIAASSVLGAAAWGAAGGATSGLLIRVEKRVLVRHMLVGALVAGGTGALAFPLIEGWMDLPPGSLTPAAGGAAGSGAYLAGVFLPAVFEVLLTRLRRGVLPTDPDRGGG